MFVWIFFDFLAWFFVCKVVKKEGCSSTGRFLTRPLRSRLPKLFAVTKDECQYLHDKLGDHPSIPKLCLYQLIHKEDKVEGEAKHRGSWLWPKLARRMTKGGAHASHPQNYLNTNIQPEECAELRKALKEANIDGGLPKDCM